MAHRPVGLAQTIALSGAASTSSAFTVQSNVIRLVAKGTGANVAINTSPDLQTNVSAADYYIPSGGTATLAMTRASQIVAGITTGATTLVTAPEGTQMPFSVGDHVSLVRSGTTADSNYATLINDVSVLSVDSARLSDNNYFVTRLTLNANTSGIITDFTGSASLVNTLKVSAFDPDGGSGVLHIQQVQQSGQA